MEERQQETGVTFGEILRAIKRKAWVVLIVTLALAAAFLLTVGLWYNPQHSTYLLTFTLSYPNSETQKYPDGTPFYYQDLTSAEMLGAAKASDERFARIDVDKLCASDDISISVEEAASAGKFTLAVKSTYFSGRAEATSFLKALAQRPAALAVEKAKMLSYRFDETAFTNADFEDRLELLAQQKRGILSQYEEWIELYRGSYTVAGKTLFNHSAEAAVLFGDVLQESLGRELETNGYVSLALLEEKRDSLAAEKEENERKIAALKEALGAVPMAVIAASEKEDQPVTSVQQTMGISETLAALIVRNAEIDSQIAALTEENIRSFESRLTEVFNRLQDGAEKLRSVGISLYEQESRVDFGTSLAVEEGGMSLIPVAIGGLIVGLFLSCLIVCLVELPKQRRHKEEKSAEQGSETSREPGEGGS